MVPVFSFARCRRGVCGIAFRAYPQLIGFAVQFYFSFFERAFYDSLGKPAQFRAQACRDSRRFRHRRCFFSRLVFPGDAGRKRRIRRCTKRGIRCIPRLAAGSQFVQRQRARNVFQVGVVELGKFDFHLVYQLPVYVVGNAYSAGSGFIHDPGGYIYAVAVDSLSLLPNIAQMQAYARKNPESAARVVIPGTQAELQKQGALGGGQRALEQNQHSPGILIDDLAVMFLDYRCRDIPVFAEQCDRTRFVFRGHQRKIGNFRKHHHGESCRLHLILDMNKIPCISSPEQHIGAFDSHTRIV